jgi:glycosyltransferase involved in cell wall biosynthesis
VRDNEIVSILFDCRYIRVGRHDGISRFTAGLVTALSKLEPLTMLISDTRQLELLPDLPWVLGPSPTSVLEPFASLRVNKYRPDVVYSPLQTIGPFGRRFRLVTTVHDLIYYSNASPPRNIPWPVRIIWRLYHLSWTPQRILLARADAQVTVSETTKALMVKNRLSPHPITVVPNAVDVHANVPRHGSSGRDLVYMGSFTPYKNVELLVKAMVLLPGYRLHLMSRIAPTERRRLEKVDHSASVTYHNGASDDEYLGLLRTAFALVSASRDEGFGLPVIESMALGTPVVLSDIPVFHEVAGEAAVYFDQNDPSSFAAAVQSIEPTAEWENRSALSLEQAEPFTWEKSAKILLGVLRSV